tara:strand:- start:184 stop:375 length:192 start_codon:yes stop_codon:yes gene_type:complete
MAPEKDIWPCKGQAQKATQPHGGTTWAAQITCCSPGYCSALVGMPPPTLAIVTSCLGTAWGMG